MESIENIINQTLDEFIADVTRRHIAAGQRATGKSIATLEKRLLGESDGFVAQVLGAPYLGSFETGRGPAKKAGSAEDRAAFVRSLAEWCKIRGFTSSGLSDEQYLRIANWLRWYLNRFGSKLYRSGGRKDIITPAIETFTENIGRRLAALYEETITNNFFNKQQS